MFQTLCDYFLNFDPLCPLTRHEVHWNQRTPSMDFKTTSFLFVVITHFLLNTSVGRFWNVLYEEKSTTLLVLMSVCLFWTLNLLETIFLVALRVWEIFLSTFSSRRSERLNLIDFWVYFRSRSSTLCRVSQRQLEEFENQVLLTWKGCNLLNFCTRCRFLRTIG